MVELTPEIEAHLASLSEAEWSALGARLRAPDTRELLRAEVAKLIGDEDRATDFASWVRPELFLNDKGDIDPKIFRTQLNRLGLIPSAPQTEQPSSWANGSKGKAEAAQRFSDANEQDKS